MVKHRRLIESARSINGVSTSQQPGALAHRGHDLRMQLVAQVAPRHRTDGGARRHGVADHQLFGQRHKSVHEALGHRGFHDEALGRNAALPGVLKARLHADCGRSLDVGVGQHDERIRAAEFKHLLFERMTGHRCNAAPDRRRAGESDGSDAVVLNQAGNHRGADHHGAEQALGQPGVLEHLLERHRALRHVAGVLEHHAVAANEHRCGRPHDLPERIVPGHHGQHQTQRVVDDAAVGGGAGNHLVGQKDRALLGIKIKVPGAFLDFAECFAQGLAHLQADDAGQRFFLLPQRGGDFVQVRAARLHVQLRPAFLRFGGLRQATFNLRFGVIGKLGEQLVVGGVDGGDHVLASCVRGSMPSSRARDWSSVTRALAIGMPPLW